MFEFHYYFKSDIYNTILHHCLLSKNAGIHKYFDRERFSKHFVYESYDDETQLFFNRGSIGFVLLACPLAEASVLAQNEIAKFLKSDENLPAESSLQVLMLGSNNIEHF